MRSSVSIPRRSVQLLQSSLQFKSKPTSDVVSGKKCLFLEYLIFIMLTSDLTFPASSSEIPLRENRPKVWVSLLLYGHDDFYVTEMDPLSGNILFSEQMEPVREAKRS